MKKQAFIALMVSVLAVIAIIFFYRAYYPARPSPPAGSPLSSNTVAIRNSSFAPSTLTIPANSTVTWINRDSTTHRADAETFNSPDLSPGASFARIFMLQGTFDYSCSIHPWMRRRIIVQ